MSEAKRSEPQDQAVDEAREDGEELLVGPVAGAPEDGDLDLDGDIDGKRGRRRSKTMSRKEIARELRRQRAFGIVDQELEATVREIEASRPRSRAECANGPRPCMFIACKHHLYLDVNPATGSIKLNFPDREVWELDETCALDVADRGGITLEEVGSIMNLTRERIRQVETRGLAKLRTIAEDEPRSPNSAKADDLLD
ncbi:sigma factor-like helix-turn-helix DNA-binding protein [Anaeromyxobacter terrae]|uniref:sigma factor-like helix-turn-helix DNA-binding protein n=1 Tax=Anaeromyxobacter terrae TaxID=2925406 RepID=UPI001F55FF7B|nr:sigma factor-like helix-turn-helix DNA-binding protein [Anaeromyxobacter sp. SG22]